MHACGGWIAGWAHGQEPHQVHAAASPHCRTLCWPSAAADATVRGDESRSGGPRHAVPATASSPPSASAAERAERGDAVRRAGAGVGVGEVEGGEDPAQRVRAASPAVSPLCHVVLAVRRDGHVDLRVEVVPHAAQKRSAHAKGTAPVRREVSGAGVWGAGAEGEAAGVGVLEVWGQTPGYGSHVCVECMGIGLWI